MIIQKFYKTFYEWQLYNSKGRFFTETQKKVLMLTRNFKEGMMMYHCLKCVETEAENTQTYASLEQDKRQI